MKMKRILLIVLSLGVVFGATARTLRHTYRVTACGERRDCPVVLRDIPDWAVSATVTSNGETILSQLDRPLGELAFVADVAGSREFRVVFSSRPSRQRFPARVHAQMWLKRDDKRLQAADTVRSTRDDMYHRLHHHGPAFESEYAAYRIYFDKKQTIDTYGKKHPGLELSETMWYPTAEQLAAGSGYDNLRVFGSVGVGTLKGWDASKRKMIHITDFARREARILARDPVRTVVEMRVEGWRYCGREIAMTSRYVLYAGHGEVQVENRIEGDFSGLVFTTGVMKMAEHRVERGPDWVAAWGRDFPENDTLKWERESVGLAVALPAGQIVSRQDDPTSYLFQLAPDSCGHIDYAFGMCWRRSEWLEGLSDAECLERLRQSVLAARSPVRVERLR